MKCFALKKGESCYPGEKPNKCCFYCEKKYLCKGVCIDIENDLDNNDIVENCKDCKEGEQMKLKVVNKAPQLVPGIAVYCDTDDKASVFLQECKMQGILSIYKEPAPLLISEWHNEIAFAINTRTDSDSQVFVGYSTKDFLENCENYKLYEFDELFKESSTEYDKINKEAVRVTGNTLEELQEGLKKSFKQVASTIPKPPKSVKTTESEEGNPMILLPRYEVLYAKNNWVDEDVKKVMQNGRSIIVVLDGGEKGIAKCHPGDKFNMVRGYNIAYARAKIELSKLEIEYFKKQLNSARAGLSGYESYLELISKDKSYE